MEQRSKEWFAARAGLITASNFHKLAGARGLGKMGESYILELVSDALGAEKPEISSQAMQWGTDQEDDARIYYSLDANNVVEEEGFIRHDSLDAGCSPDGKCMDKDLDTYGLEIKCPFNPGNHVSYMRIKDAGSLLKIESKY